MTFRRFLNEVKERVEEAIVKAGFQSIEFQPSEPPRMEFGDLSVNVAFLIGNREGMEPMRVAEAITSKIDKERFELISKFTIHPPGYINFWVNLTNFSYQTLIESLNENYGSLNIGRGKRVIIEHTSVNPNKALHYGHLRNVVLGDSIYRIFKFTGHDTKVLNWIDDSGVQVADIIVGFLYANFPLEPPESMKFDHYCGDVVYVKVNEMYEHRPQLLELRKKVLKEIEEGNSEVARFTSDVTQRIVREQLKTCWRIGARYDCLNFESHVLRYKLWHSVFDELKSRGIVEFATDGKYAGCWLVKVEDEEVDEEKVLVRSDGTTTYIAKDIPYAAWKLGMVQDPFSYNIFGIQPDGTILWQTVLDDGVKDHPQFNSADLAITVIDVRQSRLQRIISSVLNRLDENAKGRYIHLGYEIVSLSRGTARELGIEVEGREFLQMSGRKGIYINADDVLDALHTKAYEETKKRNPNESESWLHTTAEKVAVAAIRYDLLKQDLNKMIIFDLSEALRLEGETGPYIQYAYARASKILEKAGVNGLTINEKVAASLVDVNEISLLKLISKFDLYVEDALRNLNPKVLTKYAYNLATLFNTFYERSPVLKEKDEDRRVGRLALVKSFQNTIRNALWLLGIDAPDRI
ncbi:MAG: arginine--tRNA ligase [Nitrososphaerota archaeon]|nr:arginine--tRNA ligase [Nitrososphaerales archaeon]MDW8044932.1 arginine--tRNA ligase [Nitrososphaerota archaeon]